MADIFKDILRNENQNPLRYRASLVASDISGEFQWIYFLVVTLKNEHKKFNYS